MNATEKMCYAKRAFVSREAAEKSGLRPYKCPCCGYWHITTRQARSLSNPVLRDIQIAALHLRSESQLIKTSSFRDESG
jgi:hypothetical protein